jgi:Protein of unknown function (DUF2946)
MKWFRSNIKRGSRLALFALAIQFALSFGHFHGIAAEAASAHVRSLTALQPASDQGSPEHPGDICDICAVMAMANTVLFATPPVVLLPQTIAFSYMPAAAEFARVASVRVAFQPRAPPIS